MSKPNAKRVKVDQNAKKAASDKQIFISACNEGNVKLAETILRQFPDPAHRRELTNSLIEIEAPAYNGKRKVSLLFRAAQLGHVDIATLLLDNDAEINFIAPDTGSNPLYMAAQNGHADVVKLLLDHGADPNQARTDYGGTPLCTAAEHGHLDIIKTLLAAGAATDDFKYGCLAPLYNAVTYIYDNHTEVVTALLAAGANPNALVKDGDTLLKRIAKLYKIANPLILTSFTQNIDILLAYGARSQLHGELEPLPDKLLQSLTNPAAIFNTQIMYPDKVAIIGTEEGRLQLDKLKALVTVADGLEIPELKPYQPGGDYKTYAILSAQHAFLKAQGETLEADQVALATYFNLMNYQEIIGADLTKDAVVAGDGQETKDIPSIAEAISIVQQRLIPLNSSLATIFETGSAEAEIVSGFVAKAAEDRLQLSKQVIGSMMESIDGTEDGITTQSEKGKKSIAGTVQAAVTATLTAASSMSIYTGRGGAAAGVGTRAVETSTTTSSATTESARAAAPYPTAATASTSTSSNATRSNGATRPATTSPATTPTSAIAAGSASTGAKASGR